MEHGESTPQQNVQGQGNLVAGRDLRVNTLIQHIHQHPKLVIVLLFLVVDLICVAFWYQHRNATQQTLANQQILAILRELPEAKSGHRLMGQSESDDADTARAYAALEKKHELKPGTLATELPRFARRLLLDPGTSDLDRARALYATQQMPEAEKLALQSKDKALAWAGEPVMQAVQALLLAASSAEEQIKYTRALDHLRAAAALLSRERDPLFWATIQGQICLVMWRNGAYREGIELAREVLRVHERHLGLEDRRTIVCINNLALLLHAQSSLPEAETLFRRALTLSTRILGVSNPGTMTISNNLGTLLQAKGDLVGAELLFRRGLEMSKRVLGVDHPHTLSSFNNLAGLLVAKRDMAGVESLLRKGLEDSERLLGAENPDTLITLNNLAGLLQAKGDLASAEPLYRRCLEARERILGAEHPDTLTSVNNLAELLRTKGDLAGAEPLLLRAMETRGRVLGAEHSNSIVSILSLAALRHDQGRLEESERLAAMAELGFRTKLGMDHPLTKAARDWLQTIHQDRATKKSGR